MTRLTLAYVLQFYNLHAMTTNTQKEMCTAYTVVVQLTQNG